MFKISKKSVVHRMKLTLSQKIVGGFILLCSALLCLPRLAFGNPDLVGSVTTVNCQARTIGVVVDGGLTVTGEDQEGAAVEIISNYTSGDLLSVTVANGITASFSNGKLSLTGTATAAQYQAVLRTVKFSTTATSRLTRTVQFLIGLNTKYLAQTGHYYEFVATALTWANANTAASARTYYGLRGYLATITSQEEEDFCNQKLTGGASWLGGSDATTEGTWRWVTGPEGTENGGLGRIFFSGQYNTATYTTTAPDYFAHWASGEPNQSGNEDYAEMYLGGSGWNDWSGSNSPTGYLVEYGGMSGDPALRLASSTDVRVSVGNSIFFGTNF